MSDYEFWDELGKIFNAVVAYQEKSIEFNKRYINPWIRLGNVFDKQDRNREAVAAYQKAIEIDPANAQNWCDLGSAYLRTEAYDQAVHAFLKAIELDPQMGWSYSNLAMAYAAQDNHQEAISLLQQSIELLQEDKDKAVSWNRLGNLYRKLNEYELAVRAFREADALDSGNTGFRDQLDEEPAALPAGDQPAQDAVEVMESPVEAAAPAAMEAEAVAEEAAPEMPVLDVVQTEEQIGRLPDEMAAEMVEEVAGADNVQVEPVAELEAMEAAPAPSAVEDEELLAEAEAEAPVEEPVAEVTVEAAAEETVAEVAVEAPAQEPVAEVVVEAPVDEPVAEVVVEAPVDEPVAEVVAEAAVEEPVAEVVAEAAVEEPVAEVVAEAAAEEPVAEVIEPAPVNVQDVVETFTESIISMNTATETTDISLVDVQDKVAAPAPVEAAVPVAVEAQAASEAAESVADAPAVAEVVAEPLAAVAQDAAPALEEAAAPAEPVMEAEPEAVEVVSQPVEPAPVAEAPQEAVVEQAPLEPVAEAVVSAEPEVVAEAAPQEEAVLTPAEPEAVAEAAPQEETVLTPAEPDAVAEAAAQEEAVLTPEVAAEEPTLEAQPEPVVAEAQPEPFREQVAETAPVEAAAEIPAEPAGQDPQVPQEVAYEEFLKDDGEALHVLTVTPEDEPVTTEPLTRVDASGDLQMEMDTRNAHVWNELGNVYFNNGAVDDSIIAYTKAIDLDRYFAWPYSNLALAFVQKQRFNEAVLLYQRSIELFADDKEKAKSWNRLGNVYRRLNDYEHAIEAYQRADELDPDNTTLALQSRFSLLGSYQVEQTAASAV